jgi:hypothetical protein
VSCPGPRYLSRPAPLALAMIVWLSWPMAATPARAAGCHVPDRPVLATPLSWERQHRLAAWELTDEVPMAPRVLTRVPCPGEVPQVPVVTTTTGETASLRTAEVPPPLHGEPLPHADELARTGPHPFRLDRPPRGR